MLVVYPRPIISALDQAWHSTGTTWVVTMYVYLCWVSETDPSSANVSKQDGWSTLLVAGLVPRPVVVQPLPILLTSQTLQILDDIV